MRGMMELAFLLIFLFFILLNVIIGIVSSRAKKRRLLESRKQEPRQEGPSTQALTAHRSAETFNRQIDSFVEPQTADSVLESLYAEMQEKIAIPGDTAPLEEKRAVIHEESGFKVKPASELPPGPAIQVAFHAKPLTSAPASKERGIEGPDSKPPAPLSGMEVYDVKRSDTAEEVYSTGPGKKTAPTAWKRIDGLPSLKRAIVLSELLGEPKGQ